MAALQDPRDVKEIIRAAEDAANAGDFESAERLLEDAARIQEARFGPNHPDLANTLNNLGIVCEVSNKVPAADHFSRRATTGAVAPLPADHPFVATSRKNLEDFCRAQ